MRLEELNALSGEEATVQFLRCCGSRRWARLMSERRPFSSPAGMAEAADQIWGSLDRDDWLEAFAAHPRIGDSSRGRPRLDPGTGSGATLGQDQGRSEQGRGFEKDWASSEQSGMSAASQDVRARLADANREYQARFGYIFIVCASGKSADEMLALLVRRLVNAPSDELSIAAVEQAKITRLRLSKILNAS